MSCTPLIASPPIAISPRPPKPEPHSTPFLPPRPPAHDPKAPRLHPTSPSPPWPSEADLRALASMPSPPGDHATTLGCGPNAHSSERLSTSVHAVSGAGGPSHGAVPAIAVERPPPCPSLMRGLQVEEEESPGQWDQAPCLSVESEEVKPGPSWARPVKWRRIRRNTPFPFVEAHSADFGKNVLPQQVPKAYSSGQDAFCLSRSAESTVKFSGVHWLRAEMDKCLLFFSPNE